MMRNPSVLAFTTVPVAQANNVDQVLTSWPIRCTPVVKAWMNWRAGCGSGGYCAPAAGVGHPSASTGRRPYRARGHGFSSNRQMNCGTAVFAIDSRGRSPKLRKPGEGERRAGCDSARIDHLKTKWSRS